MSLLEKILKPLRKIFRETSRKKKPEKAYRRLARKPVPRNSGGKKSAVPRAARNKTGSSRPETGRPPAAKKIPVRKKPAKAVKKPRPKEAVKKPLVRKKNALKPKPIRKRAVDRALNLRPGRVAKKAVSLKAVSAKPADLVKKILIGEVTHYFPRIQVAVVRVTAGTLKLRDSVLIEGSQTEITQTVLSLQIESSDVKIVRKGQLAGLKVEGAARVGDKVYKAG
jgi:hypothetical protein